MAEAGNRGSGLMDLILSDREVGTVETATRFAGAGAGFEPARIASNTPFSDLTLFDRGREDFFSGDSVGVLVGTERAKDDRVGQSTLSGIDGFARSKSEVLDEL